MSAELSQREVETITSGIDALRRSTRRTLPLFLVGLAATLVAAAVAIYYIFSLSSDLDVARRDLLRTQAELGTVKHRLTIAQDALKRVNLENVTGDIARQIEAALFDLARSQRDVTAASASARRAEEKIAASSDAKQSDAAALVAAAPGWFAVVGSYGIDPAGLTRAQATASRVRDAGLCAEIWQTKISRNYAVVIGGRTDRATATAAAARARTTGIAADAFAQPDRDWTPLAGADRCS